MSIYTTVNAPFKQIICEEDIAGLILKMAFPDQYSGHLAVFFTEVPVSELAAFINKFNIPAKILKQYYFKYIAPVYTNKNLEEYLDYA